MTARAPALHDEPQLRLERARATLARTTARLEAWPVPRVLGVLVVSQWIVIAVLARVIRHNSWIYYQGGDQLWYYTLGWLLGHGQLGPTPVGYLWSVLLAPVARTAGPNLVSAFPAIVLFNVLVLVPVAMLALYGIAARLGGRVFGYWAAALWIIVPLIGLKYTDAGYHQRYTELTLPQSLGLTAMADLPTTVAALVSLYFCARVVLEQRPELLDGLAAGAAAGAAIAIKPSTALFLGGPALAFIARRRLVGAAAFVGGVAPAVVALAVWKGRGLGNLPLFSHAAGAVHVAGVAAAAPLGLLNLGKYTTSLNWAHLLNNIDLLREHFWSGRLIIWLIVAGLLGLLRASRPGFLLIGGSFLPFVLVKGSYINASVNDASIFRILMPCYPLFILLLASLPLLLPHAPAKLRSWRPAFERPRPRTRAALLGVAVLLSAVLPLAVFAAANTGKGALDAVKIAPTIMPVPVNVQLGLSARAAAGGRVALSWRAPTPLGGKVFYRIARDHGDGLVCQSSPGARICSISLDYVGVSNGGTFVDHPPPGTWTYRIGIGANWLDSPLYGDVYLVSRPLAVHVP